MPVGGRRQPRGAGVDAPVEEAVDVDDATARDGDRVNTSLWGVADKHFAVAVEDIDKFIVKLDTHVRACGQRKTRFQAGISDLSETAKHLDADNAIAPSNPIQPRQRGLAFNQTIVSASRSRARTCWQRHPGLCLGRDRLVFPESKVLGRSIHQILSRDIARFGWGRTLCLMTGVCGQFSVVTLDHPSIQVTAFWAAWQLCNPQVTMLSKGRIICEWDYVTANPFVPRLPITVDLEIPLCFWSNFEVGVAAARLVNRDVGIHVLEYEDISLIRVRATSLLKSMIAPRDAIKVTASVKPSISASKLAASLHSIVTKPTPSKAHHSDASSSSDDSSASNEEDESCESGASLHCPTGPKAHSPAPPAPPPQAPLPDPFAPVFDPTAGSSISGGPQLPPPPLPPPPLPPPPLPPPGSL